MNDTQWAAYIGVAGAIVGSILTAFLQPLISSRFSKRPKLHVRIRYSPFLLPQTITQALRSYAAGSFGNIEPSNEHKPVFRITGLASSVFEISIKNRGQVTCKQITLTSSTHDIVFQSGRPGILDQASYPTTLGKKVEIGDMQPGQEVTLFAWSVLTPIFSHPFSISGHDLHDVKLDYEKPASKIRQFDWPNVLLLVLTAVLTMIALRFFVG